MVAMRLWPSARPGPDIRVIIKLVISSLTTRSDTVTRAAEQRVCGELRPLLLLFIAPARELLTKIMYNIFISGRAGCAPVFKLLSHRKMLHVGHGSSLATITPNHAQLPRARKPIMMVLLL